MAPARRSRHHHRRTRPDSAPVFRVGPGCQPSDLTKPPPSNAQSAGAFAHREPESEEPKAHGGVWPTIDPRRFASKRSTGTGIVTAWAASSLSGGSTGPGPWRAPAGLPPSRSRIAGHHDAGVAHEAVHCAHAGAGGQSECRAGVAHTVDRDRRESWRAIRRLSSLVTQLGCSQEPSSRVKTRPESSHPAPAASRSAFWRSRWRAPCARPCRSRVCGCLLVLGSDSDS